MLPRTERVWEVALNRVITEPPSRWPTFVWQSVRRAAAGTGRRREHRCTGQLVPTVLPLLFQLGLAAGVSTGVVAPVDDVSSSSVICRCAMRGVVASGDRPMPSGSTTEA